MPSIGAVAAIATLIGEPARTAMLVALMGGRWLSAGELCRCAGVSAATGSGHLRQLLEGNLVAVHRQGRHRYYQLSGPEVAATVEGLMALSSNLDPPRTPGIRTGPRDPALRYARICYDHLAGDIAVAIADRMREHGQLCLEVEGGNVTVAGVQSLAAAGLWSDERSDAKPVHFCRPCLDWSARRLHVGGTLGRLLFDRFAERNWIRRMPASRVVLVTPVGQRELEKLFGSLPRPPRLTEDNCVH